MNQQQGDVPSIGDSQALNGKNSDSTERWGLLANGSSGRWDISVDESLDREEWSVEIDGPQTYLTFQLEDLNVVRQLSAI